jgi:hypothetical protein
MGYGFKRRRKDHRKRTEHQGRAVLRSGKLTVEVNGGCVHYAEGFEMRKGKPVVGGVVFDQADYDGGFGGFDYALMEAFGLKEALKRLGVDEDESTVGDCIRAVGFEGLYSPEMGVRRCLSCSTVFIGGFGACRCLSCRADIKRANLHRASMKRADKRAAERAATLTCRRCGSAIADSARSTKAFCSDRCRVAAFRARRHNQP